MLATLIASVLSGEASETFARSRRAAIAYALAGLLAFLGACFLLGAGFIAAAQRIGAMPAALWFGGTFILLSIVTIVVHRIMAHLRARRVARRRRTELTAVASAAAMAALPALLTGKGRGLAILAPAIAAIGYAIWRENSRNDRNDRDEAR